MTPVQAAGLLHTARGTCVPRAPFTDTSPDLTGAWGYATQDLDRATRLESGEVIIGAKLGLTSVAKQERMGVGQPIVGFLTDAMVLGVEDVTRRLTNWAQPRIEPEIAFLTARDLAGPITLDEVSSYVESALLAAEIIDSRFVGYRFQLPDVVADNTSAAGVVLSAERRTLNEVGDLRDLHCEVRVDGKVSRRASGAAILGQPLLALVELAAHLGRRKHVLPAGSLVLAGALTDAEPLTSGHDYELSIAELGTITITQ